MLKGISNTASAIAVVFSGLSLILPNLVWAQGASPPPPPPPTNELAQSYSDLLAMATAQWAQARQQLLAAQTRIRDLESQLAKAGPKPLPPPEVKK